MKFGSSSEIDDKFRNRNEPRAQRKFRFWFGCSFRFWFVHSGFGLFVHSGFGLFALLFLVCLFVFLCRTDTHRNRLSDTHLQPRPS